MASTCCPPIADDYPYGSIFELGMQTSKPPASSDAQPRGFAACFNLSTVGEPASMDKFRLAPPMGQFLSSGRTANLSDDEGFPFLKFFAHPKVIDLTLDDDGDDDDDDDATETASKLSTNSLHLLPSSLRKSPAHTTDDPTTSPTLATPSGKKSPWKNPPSWSGRLQQHSATPLHTPTVDALHAGTDCLGPASTEFEPPKDSRALIAEWPENSPEIPETPTVVLEDVRREGDDHSHDVTEIISTKTQSVTGASMVAGGGDLDVGMDGSFVRDKPHHEHDAGSVETEALQRGDQTEPIVNTNDSDEAHLSIAESSEQTLAPMAVSPSSVPNAGENGLAIIDISKLTMAKILDKRSSPFRVEYRCKLEPLWLAADLVERAQMGRVHIRSYENGLVRAGRLKTLRVGKPKFSQM